MDVSGCERVFFLNAQKGFKERGGSMKRVKGERDAKGGGCSMAWA